jgi:hypothetical protein
LALDPSQVAFVMQLSTDGPVDYSSAEELARLLEIREELLAYLLTNAAFLSKHPDIEAELRRLAFEHGPGALTRRTTDGPSPSAQAVLLAYESHLRSRLLGESEPRRSDEDLDQIDGELVKLTARSGPYKLSATRWIRRPS